MNPKPLLFAVALIIVPFACADPIVIAHRGASGYLPEHTLAAYARAIDQGADYIEPDLVISRDGVLVVRHDHYLGTTTDVAAHEEFASRRAQAGEMSEWFVEDFTLAEIRRLRARQAFEGRTTEYDGQYGVPTFQEVIDLVKEKRRVTGRTIGIYPETKVPSHFQALGFDFAGLLVSILEKNGLNGPDERVYIQSFEPGILVELSTMTSVPLVMLVRPASREEPAVPNIALSDVADFADGIGAYKTLLMDSGGKSSGVVERAHELGLIVHAWTFRDDAYARETFNSPEAEIERYLDLGIDGFFTDFPDTGVRARDAFVRDQSE